MDESKVEWVSLFESVADEVRAYRSRRDELIDCLADALGACWVRFPIVESGDDLDDLCPFTFFAAFCRDMRDDRRTRLLGFVSDELGISRPTPISFEGLHVVDDRRARFFGARKGARPDEVGALWDLFEAALEHADGPSAASRGRFAAAFDRIGALRLSCAPSIPTALSWIRPRAFPPSSIVAERCGEQGERAPLLSGSEYAQLAESVAEAAREGDRRVGAGGSAGSGPGRVDVLPATLQDWRLHRAPEPRVDDATTDAFIERYLGDIERIRRRTQAKWCAVRRFREQWDPDAVDFCGMLGRSLEGYEALVPANPTFNPRKDALVFAEKDPESTRAAFLALFDRQRPVVERMLAFEAATAALFALYRGSIISAIPRRSSHGNLYAISAYLFLRYPEDGYLFSPLRMSALGKTTGFHAACRVSDPDSVLCYADLCEQVRARALRNERLVAADDALRDPVRDDGDARRHLLVEDLADYAVEITSGSSARRR